MGRYDKKKKRFALPFSASHLMLYVVLMVYIGVAICGVWAIIHLINGEFLDYAIQIIIGLFSYVGATASIAVSFYSWKAKAENEIAAQNRKYDGRFELAKEVYTDLHSGRIDKDSVVLLRAIIGGTDNLEFEDTATDSVDEIMEGLTDALG